MQPQGRKELLGFLKNHRFLWAAIIFLGLMAIGALTRLQHDIATGKRPESDGRIYGFTYGWETVGRADVSLKYWDRQFGGLQLVGNVAPGEYRLTADGTGELRLWGIRDQQRIYTYVPIGPQGYHGFISVTNRVMPEKDYGSLVARLADMPPFYVGNSALFTVYKDEGLVPLRLGINLGVDDESAYRNNRGSFTVKIERRK